EDNALKRFAQTPDDQKPRFNWREVIGNSTVVQPDVMIVAEGVARHFDLAEIADTVGAALTDLLLSRQVADIYTEQNRHLVAEVAREVGEEIVARWAANKDRVLAEDEINRIIEKALVHQNQHDVAMSLVFKRARAASPAAANGDGSGSVVAGEILPVHVRLIRRNGMVVPWDQNKVEIAVRKAFLSLHVDSEPAVRVAEAVSGRVRDMGQAFVSIEDVQDLVQEELMRHGHFKVAETYILYRAERSRRRVTDAATTTPDDARQEQIIFIKREGGQTEMWDGAELRARIAFAAIDLDLCLTRDQIEIELRRSLSTEMTREDLQQTVILNAKTLIERDADFAKFAGRILLSYIYEEVLGWDILRDGIGALKPFHVRHFKKNLEHAARIERLNPALLKYDLGKLAEALDPMADLEFDFLGIQTLYDRYLVVDKTRTPARRIETPQYFWMRVSMGLFLNEPREREDWIIRLYNLYKNRRFCSSTPTLFNAGTLHSQLSSCYLYKVDDNIESIMMRGIAENAFLSKWAGGLGGSWTAVRGTGGYIKGTNGESQGVIPFLKLHNDQLVAVNQGGKRRGSGCAYLETWHNDVLDFLELRRNTGDDRRRTHDMNTANWIPDLFMKRMEAREDWTLFRANETADLHELYGRRFEERYHHYEQLARDGKIFGKTIPAIELWKLMLKMLFETGHPWITFKDPCNIRSPQDHAGVIHSSNLCTEITLNTSFEETAVCNLGSVILDTHLKPDGSLDHHALRETIRVAVRALDNVIDINFYPTKAAETSNMRHRPIGLGVMGLHNALYQRGHAFASAEAVEFNDEFMEAIAFYAYEASSDLAGERGTYSSYHGSKWDRGILPQDTLELLEQERGIAIDVPRGGRMDWTPLRQKIKRQGMRNSNVLAIAPTATISNIMSTSPCIEPYYKNLFVKSNLGGEYTVLNNALVKELKNRNLWDAEMLDQLKYFDGELVKIDRIPADLKQMFATAFDIDYTFVLDAAARRQKWIDQSQSVNLFLGKPEFKTLSHMYRAAWRKGLKTTYYLRTLGASNIEKATVAVKKETRGHIGRSEDEAPGIAAAVESGSTTPPMPARVYSEEEKSACSLEARLRGESCEACQ
ncbi:MAG TPA: ribonucleoside-diphosphate reductase subunit alpha, partial [Opitutales bacterium]|nr:ribonucleoside-diphosphate reductase subunit alpha [Opitutales bacterium]